MVERQSAGGRCVSLRLHLERTRALMKLISSLAVLVLLFFLTPAAAQTMAIPSPPPQLPGESGATVPSLPMGAQAEGIFLGGVPTGKVQPATLPLSLSEAVERGLRYNLGLLIASDDTR